MGGIDTKGRFHVHWGAPEKYGERRDESALRRSGRPVPDEAYAPLRARRPRGASTRSSRRTTTTRRRCCAILEATQDAYGHLPVAALKHISLDHRRLVRELYGTASYYRHLRFDPPVESIGICRCTSCLLSGAGRIQDALEQALDTGSASADARRVRLEQLPSHVAGAASPLVAIDGQPQDRRAATSRPGRTAARRADAQAAGLTR